MKIAVVGAGAFGGYLAAKLLAAGEQVTVLAEDDHFDAIVSRGLHLIDPDGDITVRPWMLTNDPASIGPQDLVIAAVEAHELEAALSEVSHALTPETRILACQNSVDAPEIVAKTFGPERALIGVSRISVAMSEPGVVTRRGAQKSVSIGSLDGSQRSVSDILKRFRAAGIEVPTMRDVRVDLWKNFILYNAMSSLTAGTGQRIGSLRDTPECVELARQLMVETHAVGVASKVSLPRQVIDECMDTLLNAVEPFTQARSPEIDYACGAVARRGRALGVDVRASETIYALLKPIRAAAR